MDNTLNLTAPSILSLFDTTKEQRQTFIDRVVESLDQSDPLNIHFQVKCMEDVIKGLTSNKQYKDSVLEAAQKYGQKSFGYKHSKVEIKEVGTKYDFSQCADPVLESLYQKQAEINERLKARETMLKTLPEKGLILTDEESGETFTAYPPAKSSSTSVAITLK